MKKKTNWKRILYIIGVVALIVGVLDPLEGSVMLTAGSILIVISTFLIHDRHRKIFLASTIMIVTGVFFLFYFSSLGGFGGTSTLSWWWGTLILPYPIGWLMSVVILLVRAFTKTKSNATIEKENLKNKV